MLALKDLETIRKHLYDVCQASSCKKIQKDTYVTTEEKSIKLCEKHYHQIADEVLW